MPKKTSKRRQSKARKCEPVPKEFHTVTPYLAINGATEAIEWYKKTFGAKELARQGGPEGKFMHARIRIGDSIIMLSDVFEGAMHKDPRELGETSVALHIYSKGIDALWKKAVEAGARVDMELDDMFWGERYGQLADPIGHSWSLSMRIPMSPKEMESKRRESNENVRTGTTPRPRRINPSTITSETFTDRLPFITTNGPRGSR